MNTLELSRQLIKLKKCAGEEELKVAAELIAETFEKNEMHVELIKNGENINVVGSTRGRRENAKKIIFNGHYDTVPPNSQWTIDPFNPIEKDNRLWGLGSCDMTCNMVAMINAAVKLSKENLKGEVIVVCPGDEETTGNGTKATIEKGVWADYVVIGEPTGMRLATGHKSLLTFELTSKGKAHHAAYPAKGDNAIHKMAALIAQLAEEFAPKSEKHEELFKQITLTTGLIKGGTAANVVPDKCSATLNMRLPPKLNVKEFVEEMKEKCREVELIVKLADQGWTEDETSLYVKTAKNTLEEFTGEKITEFMHKLGASDARFYSAAGIQTINVGAGEMDKLHSPNENIPLKDVAQIEQFYYKLAKKMIE